MLGTGGDTDGNEGTITTPGCQGNRDHAGGGKPPPPMIPPVQHNGDLEGYERAVSEHHSVCQWGGAEETAAVRGGDTGDLRESL